MEKLKIDPAKIAVIGDGILGTEFEKKLACTIFSRKRRNFSCDDLDNLDISKFNILINCVANTDTYSENRIEHWKTNYEFVYNLINHCNKFNVKLIHISTSYIYANSSEFSSENEVPVHCNNWYGYTKLLGDGLVQLLSKNYLICRCMHKDNIFKHDKAWIDQIGNFDFVDIICDKIINLIELNASGVFNVGTELKSMYNLAVCRNKSVIPSLSPINVPKNLTMNLEKYEKFTKE